MKDARNYFQLMICGLLLMNFSAIQKRFSFQFESNAPFSLSLSLQPFFIIIYAFVSCVPMSIHSMLPNSLWLSWNFNWTYTLLYEIAMQVPNIPESIDYDGTFPIKNAHQTALSNLNILNILADND